MTTPRLLALSDPSFRPALHDDYIGVQHLILAQLATSDGMR